MKGISVLLSTIILMGIAVTAGSSIYAISNQYAIIGFSKIELRLLDSYLQKVGDSCILYLKVMNTGTESFDNIKVSIALDDDRVLNTTITFDDRELSIVAENRYLTIEEDTTIEPSDVIIYDSIIFTNMTGVVEGSLDPALLDIFDDCAWHDCRDYIVSITAKARSSETELLEKITCEVIKA